MRLDAITPSTRHQANRFCFGVGHDLLKAAPMAAEVDAAILHNEWLGAVPVEAMSEPHHGGVHGALTRLTA